MKVLKLDATNFNELQALFIDYTAELAYYGVVRGADVQFNAYLTSYLNNNQRFGWIVPAVGFVLINQHSYLNERLDYAVAEFFIHPTFQRQKKGSELMNWVFERHRGDWEIAIISHNHPALAFWERVSQPYLTHSITIASPPRRVMRLRV